MTGDACRTKVLALVGVESGYAYLTSNDISAHLDEAASLAACQAAPASLRRKYLQNSVSGTAVYAANTAPILFVTSAKALGSPCPVLDHDELDAISPNWEASSNGVPINAYIDGQSGGILQVGFWPPPNASTANAVLIRSIGTPVLFATITTGQVLEFPDYLVNAMCKYAAYRHLICQPEQGDATKVAAYKADWDAALAVYAQLEGDNNSVSARRAVSAAATRS